MKTKYSRRRGAAFAQRLLIDGARSERGGASRQRFFAATLTKALTTAALVGVCAACVSHAPGVINRRTGASGEASQGDGGGGGDEVGDKPTEGGDQGVITGNGSGGGPDRVPTALPEEADVRAFLADLAVREPTYVRLVRNFVLSGADAPAIYRTRPKGGGDAQPKHASEECVLDGKEVRAYFDPKAKQITFCRGFYYDEGKSFAVETTSAFRVMVVMHEMLHVVLGVTKQGLGDGEEAVVSSFDARFRALIDAKTPFDREVAGLALRAQLDRDVDTLGPWSTPEEVVGEYDEVPLLVDAASTAKYPVPKRLLDADYVAPHFLEHQLASIWTERMRASVTTLLGVAKVADVGAHRAESYYQPLFRMQGNDVDQRLRWLSLDDLAKLTGFNPFAPVEPRVVPRTLLSTRMQAFLTRAAAPDIGAVRLHALNYQPEGGDPNGSKDYMFFVGD